MNKIKGIIYDLDGTLIDSAPIVISILNFLRKAKGLSEWPNQAFTPWISAGGKPLIQASLECQSEL